MSFAKKWVKPSQADFELTILFKIAKKYHLFYTSDVGKNEEILLQNFFSVSFGLTREPARKLCFIKNIKYPQWILLNALADNDLTSLITIQCNYKLHQVKKIIFNKSFSTFNSFAICDDIFVSLFDDTYASKNISPITTFSSMKSRSFANMLGISAPTFANQIDKHEITFFNFKIYLLTLGFDVDDIGLAQIPFNDHVKGILYAVSLIYIDHPIAACELLSAANFKLMNKNDIDDISLQAVFDWYLHY